MTPIFEDVLRALLIDTDIVGSRAFHMRAPQVPASEMKTPYLIFFGVGPSPMHSMNGPLAVLDREYQISIFDKSQSVATSLADTLREKLDGLRGDWSGIRFGGVFYRSQSATFELTTGLTHVIVTFRFLFQYLESFQTLNLKPTQPQRSKTL